MGGIFFSQIAQREGLRNILRQAYADPNAIDDETLDLLLKPGLTPGAVAVFLDFISYRYTSVCPRINHKPEVRQG